RGHRQGFAQGGAGEAVAEQRLVGGVDVGALADVDRGDERGVRVGEDRLALVFAQLGPARRRGALGDRAVVGELDDEHLHVRSELATPAGEELAHAVAVAGDADVAFALVPGSALEADRPERRDHPVVHDADAGVGVPRGAGRHVAHFADRIAPAFAERDADAVVHREGGLAGGAGEAAGAPRVADRDDDLVLAGFEIAGGDRVFALVVPAVSDADGAAVDPGGVEIVEHAEHERAAGGGLLGREGDGAAEPDVADRVAGEASAGPGRPRGDGGDGLPFERLGITPGFLPAARLAPPGLPGGGEGGDGAERVFGDAFEQGHLLFAVDRAAAFGRQPGADLRSAPVRMDRADRDLELLAQLVGHEVAGGREWGDGLWRGG